MADIVTVTRQRLHPDGPELSRLVWGAWRAVESPETDTPGKLARLIDACAELGITSFDHADIYGGYRAEAAFGAALREWRGDRDRLELVTKCDIALVDPARPAHRVKHYDTSAAHIRRSLEASLRQLGTDYVDLLLLHRPDPLLDADETAAVLEELVQGGGGVQDVGGSGQSDAGAGELLGQAGQEVGEFDGRRQEDDGGAARVLGGAVLGDGGQDLP